MTTKFKPQVFIASSVEGLGVADAINLNLDHDTYPTLWRTGTFQLGSSTIDDLVKKSSTVDFAIFVFTPDDVATIRNESTHVVRDNVLFELGLFIGALGKERCYVVRPRSSDMHLPSDLLGVTVADYEAGRPDGDLASALNGACKLIKDAIRAHGGINRTPLVSASGSDKSHIPNPPHYTLNETDLKFLAECVEAHLTGPYGVSSYQITGNLKREPENLVRMSAIKLSRLGLIEKVVEEGEQGNVYYVYSATENGLDTFLKNESTYASMSSRTAAPPPSAHRTSPKPAPHYSDMDDTPPF